MKILAKLAIISGMLWTLNAPSVLAQQTLSGRPIPGYVCMRLNLNREELNSRGLNVPIYASPSASAERVGQASAVLIVKSPVNVENGFAELLFFNGRRGWLQASLLRSYQTPEAPTAKCTPEIMPNGRIGFG